MTPIPARPYFWCVWKGGGSRSQPPRPSRPTHLPAPNCGAGRPKLCVTLMKNQLTTAEDLRAAILPVLADRVPSGHGWLHD